MAMIEPEGLTPAQLDLLQASTHVLLQYMRDLDTLDCENAFKIVYLRYYGPFSEMHAQSWVLNIAVRLLTQACGRFLGLNLHIKKSYVRVNAHVFAPKGVLISMFGRSMIILLRIGGEIMLLIPGKY